MRPGPGLVVMALAFISGARRGSTSTSSKISSSSTTSSSSSSSTYSSNPNSYHSSSSTSSSDTFASSTSAQSSILFPSFLAGGGVLTSTGSPLLSPSPPPSSDYNYYYHNKYPQPPFKLPDKLRHQYDDPRFRSEFLTPTKSSSRATRETREAALNIHGGVAVGDNRNTDIVVRAGGGDNSNNNNKDKDIVRENDNDDNSSGGNRDSSEGSAPEGLLVQFPSHSADSSTFFDEDDILALVAEDDLLSEESFDHLSKLTDDKIGYINEEDYGGVEFGDVGAGTGETDIEVERGSVSGRGVTASGGGAGSVIVIGGKGAKSEIESVSQRESAIAPTHASETAQKLHQSDNTRTNRLAVAPVSANAGDGAPVVVVDSGVGSSSAELESYVANLVRGNIATFTESAKDSSQQNSNEDAAKFDLKRIGLNSPVFDSTSSLTRINPWLSACDLAQPSTAPDLQGQCTAGTLPMAWVDEGPGPPSCPKSCEQIRLENTKDKNNFNYNINDDNMYLIDKTLNNFKSNLLINDNLSKHNNINNNKNNNNNNNKMSKVRRDVNHSNNDDDTTTDNNDGVARTLNAAVPTRKATATTGTKATSAAATSKSDEATKLQEQLQQQRQQHELQQDNALSYVVDDDETTASSQKTNHNSNNFNSNNNNRQSQNNNNIVKISTNQINVHSYDLKYNNLMHQEQQQQPSSRSSGGSNIGNNFSTFKHQQHHQQQYQQANRKYNQQQQQQQCLDYLGDNEESSPHHLCQLKSPSTLAHRLRSLRLRHCCERNVFTALHTIALNATLSGGTKCIRVLTDLMELDSLATRITCELAEILYRFDCRQVYSLINQCDDCKEAYRRWVCSTLIPFFAEQNDTMTAPTNSNSNESKINNSNNSSNISTTKTTTSNSTNTNNDNKIPFEFKHTKRSLTNNVEQLHKIDNTKNNLNLNIKTINVNNKRNQANILKNNNNNKNDDNNKDVKFNYNFNKRSERRTSRSTTTAVRSAVAAFYDAIDSNRNIESDDITNIENSRNNNNNKNNINSKSNNFANFIKNTRDADGRCIRKTSNQQHVEDEDTDDEQHQQHQHKQQQQQHAQDDQHNNFISTATNEDPCDEDPVISKLLKRSKRKIEFHKRRRIRPCLSVCQTVEQKCPYLLPADRAPALPTQYAGEPTFLCLDPNIDEVGEQLRKSNHGPPDCCYTYCPQPVHGICAYCTAFAESAEDANNNATMTTNGTTINISSAGGSTPPTRRVHNITLTTTSVSNRTNGRAASVAIALLNISTISSDADLERLPYYAYYEGNYFYDYIDEMPHQALAECQPVPSVSSRCTIPYYASSATSHRSKSSKDLAMRALLLCLSAVLCLINSYYVMEMCRARGSSNSGADGGNRQGNGGANSKRRFSELTHTKELRNQLKEIGGLASRKRITFLGRGARGKRKKFRGIRQLTNSNIEMERKVNSSQWRRRRWNYSSHDSNILWKCKTLNRNKVIIIFIIANNYYDYSKFRKVNSNCSQDRCSKINSSKYSSKNSNKINTNTNNNYNSMKNISFNKNYHFQYFYNFNINDLWRRWWIRSRERVVALSLPAFFSLSLHEPKRRKIKVMNQTPRTMATTTS